jgi:hypothetical protein
MTERTRLPNKRASESFDLVVNDLKYTATVSCFNDGRLAEVFITNSKSTSHSAAIARDAGILVSLCLQFGCPPETIAHALTRNTDGTAATVAGAILDVILTTPTKE